VPEAGLDKLAMAEGAWRDIPTRSLEDFRSLEGARTRLARYADR
jgi:hypothetical protein